VADRSSLGEYIVAVQNLAFGRVRYGDLAEQGEYAQAIEPTQ
jgi:hypothetical protein